MCVIHLTNNGEVPHFYDTDTKFDEFVSGGIEKAKDMEGENDEHSRCNREKQAD